MNRTITLHDVLTNKSYEQTCSTYLTEARKTCAKVLAKESHYKSGPLLKLYKKQYFTNTEEFTKCAIHCLERRSLLPTDQQAVIRQMFKAVSLQILQIILKEEDNANNGSE